MFLFQLLIVTQSFSCLSLIKQKRICSGFPVFFPGFFYEKTKMRSHKEYGPDRFSRFDDYRLRITKQIGQIVI